MSPSRAWGKIYIPKLELGNEKKLVGRASPPARRSAQAGKPVPPEERLQDRINVAGTEARPTGFFMIYGCPQAISRPRWGSGAIDAGRRI